MQEDNKEDNNLDEALVQPTCNEPAEDCLIDLPGGGRLLHVDMFDKVRPIPNKLTD